MTSITEDLQSVKSLARSFATKRTAEYFGKNCKGRGNFNKMKIKIGYKHFLNEILYATQNGEFTGSHKFLTYMDELITLAEKDEKIANDKKEVIFKKLEKGEKVTEEEIETLRMRSPYEDACYMYLGELQIYVWLLWEAYRIKNQGVVKKMELEDLIYKRDIKKFAINPRYKQSLEEIEAYNKGLKKINSEVQQDLLQ